MSQRSKKSMQIKRKLAKSISEAGKSNSRVEDFTENVQETRVSSKDVSLLRNEIGETPSSQDHDESCNESNNFSFQFCSSNEGTFESDFIDLNEIPEGSVMNCIDTSNIIDMSVDNLAENLRVWAIKTSVNHVQLSSLLHILKIYHPELPLDARTLLKTPVTTPLNNLENSDSQFLYLGIKSNVVKQLELGLDAVMQKDNLNTLELICNVDGIPSAKSSSAQFWPILGMVHLKLYSFKPFAIAIHYGHHKPQNLDHYLKDFIMEVNALVDNGLEYNSQKYKVKLKAIVCDAPARAFLKCIKGHTGFYSCERCHVKGEYNDHRLVFPKQSFNGKVELRSDKNFRQMSLKEHHLSRSPLLQIHDFDIIFGMPLDYMHMICLGIARRLLNIWCKNGKTELRLSPNLKEKISRTSREISRFIPTEFSRKPRTLSELDRWKATEFRLFIAYTGIVLLKGILPDNQYKHFLYLFIIFRITGSGNYSSNLGHIACQYSQIFIEKYEKLYGVKEIVYNVHSFQHLVEELVVNKHKLDDVSCFPFESYLGQLKKLLRQPNKPLQQVFRRLGESFDRDIDFCTKHTNGIVKPNNDRDCFILLRHRKVMKVISVSVAEEQYEGYIFTDTKDFFHTPLPSGKINVFQISNLGTYKFKVKFDDALSKCLVLPHNDYFVAIPLL